MLVLTIHQALHNLVSSPDMTWKEDTDGLYEASATILALVGFGSTIGVKISANKMRAAAQLAGLTLVFGASSIVIMVQVVTMMGLCCWGLFQETYGAYILLTGISLLVMLLGYAVLVMQSKTEDDVDLGFEHEVNADAKTLATGSDSASEQASDDPKGQDT